MMTLQCIGSTLYHGIPTRWSGHFDVIGIYLFLATFLLLSVFGLVGVSSDNIFIALVFVIAIIIAFVARVFPNENKSAGKRSTLHDE